MNAIRASVRKGRVETERPLDFPDGTEVLIVRSNANDNEEDRDNTPEAIAAWLKWYDSLQPLILTTDERIAWEEDRKAHKTWELAHSDERAEKLQRLWE